eukprot:TRINITY_DN36242_c0_g7_i1.p2 TRINITY_DN36242_c0_g7~~TRINITY_DN36242_c0_g7_i1.p2  ORF type:complete len:381 (+),score=62.21 TRINITY_DN36242_c0_g7_i1:183-1325(+)
MWWLAAIRCMAALLLALTLTHASAQVQRWDERRWAKNHLRYAGYRVPRPTSNEPDTCLEPQPCRRVANLPQSADAFLAEHMLPRLPVVIAAGNSSGSASTGAGEESMAPPAMTSTAGWGLGALDSILKWSTFRWTADYLRAMAGDLEVFVEQKDARKPGDFGAGAGQWTSFSRFITEWYDSDDPTTHSYMNVQALDAPRMLAGPLARLTSDFAIPTWFLAHKLYSMNMWIGRADPTSGATSRLHHDYHDNLYCQVQGRKTFVLYGPDDTTNLYPVGKLEHLSEPGIIYYQPQEAGGWGRHFSQMPTARWERLTAEQQSQFPRAKAARRMECEVRAGEMLYLPAGWWHEVTSYGQNIAVNFWADPPSEQQVLKAMAGNSPG